MPYISYIYVHYMPYINESKNTRATTHVIINDPGSMKLPVFRNWSTLSHYLVAKIFSIFCKPHLNDQNAAIRSL